MADAVFAAVKHFEYFMQYNSESYSHTVLVPLNFCYLQGALSLLLLCNAGALQCDGVFVSEFGFSEQ